MDRMHDHGPVYHETDLSNFVAEPWNALSSLIIALPAVYFLIKYRGQYKIHAFIIYFCAPLLIMNGLGSTLFHAFRAHVFFLIMDVLPVVILTLGISIFFLFKLLKKWYYVTGLVIILVGLRMLIFNIASGSDAINLSYLYTGMLIFIPGLLFVIKTKYSCIKSLLLSTLFFAVALFFRFYDQFPDQLMPMGTHWLWHIFTGIGAFFLGRYLINLKLQNNYTNALAY